MPVIDLPTAPVARKDMLELNRRSTLIRGAKRELKGRLKVGGLTVSTILRGELPQYIRDVDAVTLLSWEQGLGRTRALQLLRPVCAPGIRVRNLSPIHREELARRVDERNERLASRRTRYERAKLRAAA